MRAAPDPRTWLPRVDGAIVGRLLERRVEGRQAVHVFRVVEAVKGRFGATVEVTRLRRRRLLWARARGRSAHRAATRAQRRPLGIEPVFAGRSGACYARPPGRCRRRTGAAPQRSSSADGMGRIGRSRSTSAAARSATAAVPVDPCSRSASARARASPSSSVPGRKAYIAVRALPDACGCVREAPARRSRPARTTSRRSRAGPATVPSVAAFVTQPLPQRRRLPGGASSGAGGPHARCGAGTALYGRIGTRHALSGGRPRGPTGSSASSLATGRATPVARVTPRRTASWLRPRRAAPRAVVSDLG